MLTFNPFEVITLTNIGVLAIVIFVLFIIFYMGWLWGEKILMRAFKFFFYYGLKPRRAIGSVIGFLLAGWLAVNVANQQEILVLDTMPIDIPGEIVVKNKQPLRLLQTQNTSTIGAVEQVCGDMIDPLLYAMDIFIPLVDLRQEFRCKPTAEARGTWWSIAKVFYSVLGWIVISITILSITGVIRRRAEGSH